MHLWSAATMVTMFLVTLGGLTSFLCSGEGFAFISSLEGVWDWLTLCRLRIELPLPVYFHAVTVSGEGKMVMFGGVDSIEQNTRTNKVLLLSSLFSRYQPLPRCSQPG